jgi:NTE family protein
MRHIIAELSAMVPPERAKDNSVAEMRSYGCTTTMHVVRLLAPALEYEDHSKDIDFSREGIRQRWEAGYRDTMVTLEQAPWRGEFDPLEGFILHEACGGELVQTAAGRA